MIPSTVTPLCCPAIKDNILSIRPKQIHPHFEKRNAENPLRKQIPM